jgi:hypothetical protein
MKPEGSFEQDLASIRQLMERSVKFISFSGLSGILAGVYALVGAAVAWYRIGVEQPFRYTIGDISAPGVMNDLVVIALVVLIASLTTGLWISSRKARSLGVNVWDQTGKRMFINLGVPLVTGGIFIILLLLSDHYGLIAAACLIFYGLALVNASPNLVGEVRYLGYLEITLGLAATAFPGTGLFLWAIGFGVLHILYGSILFRKYK